MNPGRGIEGKERAVTSRYPLGFMSYCYIVTGVKKNILFRRNLLSLLAKWEGIVAKSHRLKKKLHWLQVTMENIFVARLNELQLIEDTTWLRGDMKFIFECSTVRYRVEHEKRNFISPSNHVLFFLFY